MRRSTFAAFLALVGCAALLPSCAWDGHFDILGYSTQPNYDTCYKTVRVPIFKTRVNLIATPIPGVEQDLTEAVVREIQLKTPYKIDQGNADTELTGTIVGFTKGLLNYTQFNTVREVETTLIVALVWRDLRTGKILTRPTRRPGQPLPNDPRQPLLPDDLTAGVLPGSDGLLPPGSKPAAIPIAPRMPTTGDIGTGPVSNEFTIIDPQTREKAVPVTLRSIAHFRPELGESITTGLQKNINRMAVQIVSVMEKGW
jgi:Lipopolysaccharide-assembly